ncbi:MAG: glycogen synthase GlgA [Eubacteriales bacterium]|nr:glycogen synthase GlgA [Eubacteriales bacterium]
MKVLFASAEVSPFFKAGGLGDVAGSLPDTLCELGADTRVIMPLYSTIAAKYRDKMTYLCNFNVPLGWRNQYCGVFTLVHNGVTHYFLDNEYYFKRDYAYGQYDDAERFSFFSKAVLESLTHIGFMPDILHCNDWHTALIPTYLRCFYSHLPAYWDIRSIFTIHNIQYQGIYDKSLLGELFGLPADYLSTMEFEGCINLLKGAIETSHIVTTVSPTYAAQIKSPEYAHGLDGILRANDHKLIGIINGIDTREFDPQTDPALPAHFSAKKPANKLQCKLELQKMLGLPQREDVPVVGMISRLVDHKGFDLVEQVMESLVGENLQVVLLGTGEARYEDLFRNMAYRYPDKVSASIAFSNDLAHKIYAGADMFLMPSKSEPCGLAQLISMRYGTIPLVRETGGLKDTVQSFNEFDGTGNGFSFTNYNANDMLYTLRRALGFYHSPQWKRIVSNAMTSDYSWAESAKAYMGIYSRLTKRS